ncbi:MAG: glycogen-debranching protein [Candidatus Hydrogenedentes bacterium]|nr:glycogen-debranching protein [Candidatus Hydrogenedentota bacterium]
MPETDSYIVRPGHARPLGATPDASGVHFAVFSRHATQVWLALFDSPNDSEPAHEIAFDPVHHRIGDVWTIHVENLKPGALYMYRMAGPQMAEKHHRYESARYLIDPYALELFGDPSTGAAKCVVQPEGPGWAHNGRPRTPIGQTIIYEVHVKGFTAHPSSQAEAAGTFRALAEKIPYLKELGITAVEFLPVYHCGERMLPRKNPDTGEALVNYWGYSPIAFFAPDQRFGSGAFPIIEEFRSMVSALHAESIEVYLDVVYNHTSEKDEVAQSFAGIDNSIYYILDGHGKNRDLTGCGNTLNCNHPVVRDLILESLRYWVTQMHVDGFRFDLASVLRRDRWGHVLPEGPLVEHISEDPMLRDTKLIAEPWDLGGSYLVGAFGGERWAEWNAQYRDDVRRFWRGDKGAKGNFAQRITGSQDLYGDDGRTPLHSINFITAHDGFTLRDLVSYASKQNRPNGEDNRDGLNENFSMNCGVEGETSDAKVNALRLRMQKNFLATLFTSFGVPMLLGGDEIGRTQRGNNNAYCQDNEISWFDWSLLESNRELFTFCKGMIAFRKENAVYERSTYFTGKPSKKGKEPDLLWFDEEGEPQLWTPEDLPLGCYINGTENGGVGIYLLFNPSPETVQFALPNKKWRMRIDTSQTMGEDIVGADQAQRVQAGNTLVARPYSMMVLTAHP